MGGMRKNILNIIANTKMGGKLFMTRKAEVDICYEGQTHQIDLDTLVLTLLHFSEITKAIAKEIVPNEQIQIKINATEKGSFNIKLEIVKELFGFFKNDNIIALQMLLGTLVGIFQLKEYLKGKKPDKVVKHNENITVFKDDSKLIITDKVFKVYSKNVDANKNMEEWFDKLSEIPEVEGLSIDAKEAGVFRVKQSNFHDLAQENELLEDEEEVEIVETELSIVKIVFTRKRKWEFIFQGNKISALVTDEQFWDMVDSQVSFAKGDILIVKLEITKIYDHDLKCHINKRYKVIKVFEHQTMQQKQQQLQLPMDD